MEALENLLKRAKKLNLNKILNRILKDKAVQKFILDLNKIDQLYNSGIDSEGSELGEYSDFTKMIKRMKGQRFDHITLNDTGDFYGSFKIVLYDKEFEINANTIKEEDGMVTDLMSYGEILGLTDENLIKLIDVLKERIYDAAIKQLLQLD